MVERQHEEDLKRIVYGNDWFMKILRTVRECNLPNWFVGAGVIRSIVWDYLHRHECLTPVKDVDVVYFNLTNLSQEQDEYIVGQLAAKLPGVPWDVTNQAAVHLWFQQHFGYSVSPLQSCEDAVSTWPETATSIGVRLLSNDELYIYAPFGLEDLFSMTLRRNPKRVTVELFRKRTAEKRILQKWPKVKVIDG